MSTHNYSVFKPYPLTIKQNVFYVSDKTCFERFFQHEDIVGLLDRFVIYHVDAPGQVRIIIIRLMSIQ